jgi:methionyl-tRNA synthetase
MEKFFITTSIAYTNAPPHIGFALEAVQADVLARYHRFLNKDVFFLTGTDEHGIKIEKAAKKAGKTPEDFTNDISAKFQKLKQALNLSNDDFIRTTDRKKHWPNVEKIWLQLKEKGDIEKKKYKGLYCVGCEAFVKEKDLIEGECPIHKEKPQIIEEENYFFKLSKYSPNVKRAIEENKIKIIPEARKNEILNIINQGLEDISISRSKEALKWGIPVPDDSSQIIYVWFEALINYLYQINRWPADVQCIGKDIFRFHALMWPAMLLALDLPLPKNILVHGFITSRGQKMSKSLGNVISPFDLVDKYGTDAVRYFLLREITPTEDGDFTYEKFEERYNSDLASGLGNLVSRVLALSEKNEIKNKNIIDKEIENYLKTTEEKYKSDFKFFKFNECLSSVWELVSYCDKYAEQQKIWEKSNKQLTVISDLLFAISKIAALLIPFLPETSQKITEKLKENKKGESLFNKIKK